MPSLSCRSREGQVEADTGHNIRYAIMSEDKKKLLYIKWIDAASPCDTGWQQDEDMAEFVDPAFLIEDVGWVYKESKDYIVLVGGKSQFNVEYSGCFHRIIKIPKAVVKQKIDLTRHVK